MICVKKVFYHLLFKFKKLSDLLRFEAGFFMFGGQKKDF